MSTQSALDTAQAPCWAAPAPMCAITERRQLAQVEEALAASELRYQRIGNPTARRQISHILSRPQNADFCTLRSSVWPVWQSMRSVSPFECHFWFSWHIAGTALPDSRSGSLVLSLTNGCADRHNRQVRAVLLHPNRAALPALRQPTHHSYPTVADRAAG